MSKFTDDFKYEWSQTEAPGKLILIVGVVLSFIFQPRLNFEMMTTKYDKQ